MKQLTKIKAKNKIKKELYEICNIFKSVVGKYPTINIICEGLEIGPVLTKDKEATDANLTILANALFEGGLRYEPRDPMFGREEGGGSRDPSGKEREYDPAFKFEGSTRLSKEMQDMVNRGLGADEAKINFEDFLNNASDSELVAWAKRNKERQEQLTKQQEAQPENPETEANPFAEPEPQTPAVQQTVSSPLQPQKAPTEKSEELPFDEPQTTPGFQDVFVQWLQSKMNEITRKDQQTAEETSLAQKQETDALTRQAAETINKDIQSTSPVSDTTIGTRGILDTPTGENAPVISPISNIESALEVDQKTAIATTDETKTNITRPPEQKTAISAVPPIIPFVPVEKGSIPAPEDRKKPLPEPSRGSPRMGGGGGSGGQEVPATNKTSKKDSGLDTPEQKPLDVRYPALRATANQGVLPIYENVHKPKPTQQKTNKKGKYTVVVVGEGGKKQEVSANSLSGIKRLVYGQSNFKVYNSQGTDISGHFNQTKNNKK